MARKKDYCEVIAEHIAAVVEARQIEDVLHFTRLKNIPGILAHGLRTRSELVNADFDAYVRIPMKPDGYSDAKPDRHSNLMPDAVPI